MHRAQLTPLAALAAAAIVAGCGSSSSHSSSAAPAASGQPAASSTSSGAGKGSYGGGYGGGAYGSASSSTATAGKTTASTAAAGTSTAAPAAGTSSTGTAVSITTKSSKLGTILAYGPKHLTVYLFEGDKGAGSNCSGACSQVWPPVTGHATAAGGAIASDLSTIKRTDGTTQVTYNGHPLYLFAKDRDSGDAYGQGINGFGASWYVLKPSGAKVDKS